MNCSAHHSATVALPHWTDPVCACCCSVFVPCQYCRYPAPTWWSAVTAFEPEDDSDDKTAAARVPAAAATGFSRQPDSYVFIAGTKYQLASIPTDGSQILVDITHAAPQNVRVGSRVCLLCSQHTLGDLAQVRRDGGVWSRAWQYWCVNGVQPPHQTATSGALE